jgi:hypothetical protein
MVGRVLDSTRLVPVEYASEVHTADRDTRGVPPIVKRGHGQHFLYNERLVLLQALYHLITVC